MASTFEVVAEPTRRRILDLLRDRERSVGELVERLSISQPGVSKHLRVLRDAGLVHVRTDAQRRWYGRLAEPLSELDEWLEPYRRLWAGRLAALERLVDESACPWPPPPGVSRRRRWHARSVPDAFGSTAEPSTRLRPRAPGSP